MNTFFEDFGLEILGSSEEGLLKKYKKKKKKVAKLKKKLEESEERYAAMQQMLEMTNQYLTQIQEELHNTAQNLKRTNIHLTDSINYAQRIQNAIAGSTMMARHSLPDSFVLFRPKDVVSGDIPWFYKHKHYHLFAAIDCTGHGVPGAMLTVLAVSLLNQIVADFQHHSPLEILQHLDSMLHSYTHGSSGRTVNDGLDIAFCCFDEETNILSFCGAYRPLCFIRNGEIQQIKGSRYSIGDNDENRHRLEEHQIELQQGDQIVIFSDGYSDQFGGERGFKVTMGQFQRLLLKVHDRPMQEQHTFLNDFFESWKGEVTQTDDVLVIGVRF